ncbi:hypothetical protein LX32DRAFT_638663 [Colletotrichum zoysiae]|uniref:Uncharacterized protein n=1 Tax=Colletotrichum zoysiae TaxID=1216348 RepID=A0AAD9HKS5_9PEZI|nr:hypothetical protein LX32DRAFT_638663 [Colletotrichum zoysiae]
MRFTALFISIFAVLQATGGNAQGPQDCLNDKNCGGKDCTIPPAGSSVQGNCINGSQGGCVCTY